MSTQGTFWGSFDSRRRGADQGWVALCFPRPNGRLLVLKARATPAHGSLGEHTPRMAQVPRRGALLATARTGVLSPGPPEELPPREAPPTLTR